MRRKIHLLLPFLLLAFVFVACEETEEENLYPNWKERNEAFIDSLQNVVDANPKGELKVIINERNNNKIFYKIRKEGDTSAKRPFETSKVDVYYRGMLIDEAVFNANPDKKYYTELYEDLFVFDSNFKGDTPVPEVDGTYPTAVNGNIISGWTAVLQWMYPGARWEVYIPYQSAYDSKANGSIPAYSTLIFDITLEDVDYFPKR